MQLLLRHSEPLTQVWPFFFLQAPAASHAFAPEHELGSSAFITVVHVPEPLAVPSSQRWQVPQLCTSQQTPSVHQPVLQALLTPFGEHELPRM